MFKKSSRVLLVTLLLFVLAGATYAFAADNTVEASFAGDGSKTISGYYVVDVNYILTTGFEAIESVGFKLEDNIGANLTASKVAASLTTGGTLVPCTSSDSGTTWSCPFSGSVSVLEADLLRVIAVQ
jgi:hypothetical protein